jgi:sugar lactone lactonase YvrE
VNVEVALEAHARVGEGPVWDERTQTLVWVDILACVVHRFDPSSGVDRAVDVGQPVGTAGLRADGGLVLALRDGFATLSDAGELTLIADVEKDNPGNRMNDGKPDPAGRFWAGTMAFDPKPGQGGGALYRLDPDFTVTRMLSDVTLSNGLDWSPDLRHMYYIDSMTQRIDLFEFDASDSSLSSRRIFIDIPREAGLPDGMTVDAEGAVWVALHGAGVVHRYLPNGQLDAVVRVPGAMLVTCPTFGGPDYRDLYITSMVHGLTADALAAQPLAGALFRCRPGVQGRPPFRFAA